MRAAAMMLAVLTVACGVRKNVDPLDPKTWGDRKDIWVFVAPQKELDQACRAGVMPPTVITAAGSGAGIPVPLPKKFEAADVLVPEELLKGDPKSAEIRLPYSCVDVDEGMFKHEATHEDHRETVVLLKKSEGDTARFRGVEDFIVQSIEGRRGKEPVPFSPKVIDLPTVPKKEHDTGPLVRDFPSLTFTPIRYKVVFIIRGYRIDPDLDCKP